MNFLQYREESDCREEALTRADTSLSNLAEERKFVTSELVICSLGSGMSFHCSALICQRVKTIALNECASSKFVVDTFSFSSLSFTAPVAVSSLNRCLSFSSSSFLHEVRSCSYL